MKHILLLLLVGLSLTTFAQGNREFSIDFSYLFSGNTAVALGSSTHTHIDGAQLRFDLANYYVSNIRLVPTSGADVVYDTVLLITSLNAGQPYTLGQVPAGVYQTIKFDLGIDSARNHSDPTTYAANHPLALNFPSMHWSWNSGYIFLRVEGEVDTTAAQSGGLNTPFEYHIGTDNFRKEVSVPIADLEVDAYTHEVNAHIDFLLGTLIGNVSLMGGTDLATHTMDNMMLANNIATSSQSSFVGEVDKVQLPTSTSDIDAAATLSLYPNPMATSTTLKIATSASKLVEVMDVAGKVIFSQTMDGNSMELHRNQFPSAGLYLVKVSGEATSVRKLVVY